MQDAIYERMKAARKILKDNPDNAYAHYLLGSSYFSRRNMGGEQAERAEKEARKAISLDPELWDAHWLLTMSHIKNNVFKKRDLKEVKNLLVPIQQGNPGYRCADKMIYYHEYASDCTPKNLIKFLEANHWK